MVKFKELKDNILKKENAYFFILIVIIFLFDRISKLKVITNLQDSTYYVNDYINLDLIWNIGVGFGFLSTTSIIIYNLITILIASVILILFLVFITSKNLDKLVYAMIIGGAAGNLYDRLIYKAVPDFIDIHYNNFHWFTFNVADIFITVGIIIFITKGFLIKDKL